jgi:NAD(P)-dependent dehydrogenase (short-subunit alcohol dehydrogenase family)
MAAQRTVVLTGASSGLGASAAASLASAGWRVAVVGRNVERTNLVAQRIGGEPFVADYDRLDDVRALAAALLARYDSIDALANNAGGLVGQRGVSADGHERTFQHNHLAPFLLTNLLMERLIASTARVVNTASVANLIGSVNLTDLNSLNRAYLGGWRAYGTSKLETILFTRELAKRSPLTAWSFHPGSVRSNFGTDTARGRVTMTLATVTQVSAEAGGAPLVHLVADETIDAPSGTYFDRFRPHGRTRAQARDSELATELWDASAAIVGV